MFKYFFKAIFKTYNKLKLINRRLFSRASTWCLTSRSVFVFRHSVFSYRFSVLIAIQTIEETKQLL